MILVDSSVWVAALRTGESGEARALRRLLDDDAVALAMPVRLELLAGASARQLHRLRPLFSALPLWIPKESTWWLIDSWIETAARAGQRFGMADLLIAGQRSLAAIPPNVSPSAARRICAQGVAAGPLLRAPPPAIPVRRPDLRQDAPSLELRCRAVERLGQARAASASDSSSPRSS